MPSDLVGSRRIVDGRMRRLPHCWSCSTPCSSSLPTQVWCALHFASNQRIWVFSKMKYSRRHMALGRSGQHLDGCERVDRMRQGCTSEYTIPWLRCRGTRRCLHRNAGNQTYCSSWGLWLICSYSCSLNEYPESIWIQIYYCRRKSFVRRSWFSYHLPQTTIVLLEFVLFRTKSAYQLLCK